MQPTQGPLHAARAIDNLSKELRRCWAKLDGRAATLRRLLGSREESIRYKWMAVRMAMKAWRERDEARIERHKLRDAIQRAGFEVCQASGDWTIHDVSELAKADEQRTDAVIAENIDLELENKRLSGETNRLRVERQAMESSWKIAEAESKQLRADLADMTFKCRMALCGQEALQREISKLETENDRLQAI